MFENRSYRGVIDTPNLDTYTVTVSETNLCVRTRGRHEKAVLSAAIDCRAQIEGYLLAFPAFLTTLVPWPVPGPYPPVVGTMVDAATRAGVGPMAAVAGAVSESVGRVLLDRSPELMIENGGDIFAVSDRAITVAVFAGDSPLSNRVGIRVTPGSEGLGICTSSGRIGHSLSFGKAHAACVLSGNTALADAAATALCNRIQQPADMAPALDWVRTIAGVSGALSIVGDQLAAWGDLEIVPLSASAFPGIRGAGKTKKGLSFHGEKDI